MILPNSYQEWKRCITVDCGIKLTQEYVEQRLRALRDERDEHTIQFMRLYGKAHLNNVINWFERALDEV
ncbi:MAG: hypothetical protein ACK42Y_07085 [Candidatus Thermochlorobacter sp.]